MKNRERWPKWGALWPTESIYCAEIENEWENVLVAEENVDIRLVDDYFEIVTRIYWM